VKAGNGQINVQLRTKLERKPIMKAIWKGTVLAESNDTVVVEGNHYFPTDSVNWEHLKKSGTHTVCSWKGLASYYDVEVGGEVNRDAAWRQSRGITACRNCTL
jgi:uncharacterized protein (DUF427 family)